MADEPKEPSALVIPFGKHRGRTVAELLATDPGYADWITTQGWVAERFAELHAAILTRGAGTDDTPEHNAIQVRFLDPVFRVAFAAAAAPRLVADNSARARDCQIDRLASRLRDAEGEVVLLRRSFQDTQDGILDRRAKANEVVEQAKSHVGQPPDLTIHTVVEFERCGVDVTMLVEHCDGVVFRPQMSVRDRESVAFGVRMSVEIKPSMGDDYPTVMRQMSRLGASYLMITDYNGRGASFPEVRAMFSANHQTVVLLREVEAELPGARVMLGG